MFKSYLNSLMATLNILKHLLEEVKNLKETPDQQTIQQMEFCELQIKKAGEERVRKCSMVGSYNVFMKWYYGNKLMELNEILRWLTVATSSRYAMIWAGKILELMVQQGQGISSSLGCDQVVAVLSSNAAPPPEPIPPPSEPEIQLVPLSPSPRPLPPPVEPPPSTELELPPLPPRFSHNNSNIIDNNGSATCRKHPNVLKLLSEARLFKPILEKLKAKLRVLEPVIREIESLTRQLYLPDAETAHIRSEMDKGAVLVQKCSNVPRFNIYKKSDYASKLLELDKNLHGLVQKLQVQAARDAKKSSVLVQQFGSHHQVISMPPPPSQDISNLTNIDNNESASGTSKNNEGQVAEKFLGRILLGKALELLCDALNETQDKDVMFKPILKEVKAMMKILRPIIKEIESLNRALGVPDTETADMKLEIEKGAELVLKYSNLPRFKFYKRSHYTKKLLRLNENLRWFVQMLQIQAAGDMMKSLVLLQKIPDKIIGDGGRAVELHENLSRVSSNVTSIGTAPVG